MEFALIATLLMTLLLGIVIFGVLLSKRQVLTQAAAEGARYAVPVTYDSATVGGLDRLFVATRVKTNQSLDGIGGRQCPSGTTSTNVLQVGTLAGDGISCRFTVFDCDAYPTNTLATTDCIEVKVEISVNKSPAIVPGSSFIDPFLPNIMTGRSVVGLSGLDS